MGNDSIQKFDALTEGLSRRGIKNLVMAYVLAGSIDYVTLTDITIEIISDLSDDGALKLGKSKEIYLGVRLTDDSPFQYLRFNKATNRKWTTTQSIRWYGREEADIVVRTGGTGDIGSIKIPPEILRRWWGSTESKTRLVHECKVDGLGYQLRLSFDVTVTLTYKLKVYVFIISVVGLLATIHMRLYERRRLLGDLDAAISQQLLLKYLVHSVFACAPWGVAASAAGHALPRIAYDLRAMHQFHFAHTGDLEDIAKSIAILESFVVGTKRHPIEDEQRYCRIGRDYMVLYLKTRAKSYGERARSYSRKAYTMSPDNFTVVSVLTEVLQWSFNITGKPSYLEETITTARKAMTLSRGPIERGAAAEALGSCLANCFRLTRSQPDVIDEAISCFETASTLSVSGSRRERKRLGSLAYSLGVRFDYSGQLVDLEQAISLIQSAIQLEQTGSPMEMDSSNFAATLHHDLAVVKMKRYDRLNILSDLEAAILAGRKSVEISDGGDQLLPRRLSHLGNYLELRFQRLKSLDDLKESIYLQNRALALTPKNDLDFRERCSLLSYSYGILAVSGQDPDAFDQSIAFANASIDGMDETTTNYPELISNASLAYIRRHESEARRQPQDLEFAIALLRQTIRDIDPSNPTLQTSFMLLADALSSQSTATGQLSLLAESVELLERTASSQVISPYYRYSACLKWITAIGSLGGINSTVMLTRAYDTFLEVLAVMCGLEHTMEQRHKFVESVCLGTIVANAGVMGFAIKNPNQALEWLERGRCLLWNQLHSLRTPLDELRNYDEALAHRVLSVSQALERAGGRQSVVAFDAPFDQRDSHQNEVLRHAQLGKEWEELLQTVRSKPGFDRFLMPPSCSDLFSSLPEGGHVVVINVFGDFCHAIALWSGCDNALSIHLPNFSKSQAVRLSEALHTNLVSSGLRYRSHSEFEGNRLDHSNEENRAVRRMGGPRRAEDVFNKILRELWTDLVKPIIDALGITPSDSPGRIWWCPTGTIAFLPIHAAGIYSSTSTHHPVLSDYAVSSYIPTVSSLTSIIKHRPNVINASAGLMIVAQANTPGLPALPGTVQEAIDVDAQMVAHGVRTSILEGEHATTGGVIENMKDFSCIHLACHATQDQATPLDSAFHLQNGQLQLRSIVKNNLRNADIAFLSACQTSTGASGLSDEAAHLAGGMMAAGYRGVVASMWSLQDVHAPTVAKNFYAELLRRGGGRIDGSQAAYALHHSIQMLRAELGNHSSSSFLAWAPYVHFGL